MEEETVPVTRHETLIEPPIERYHHKVEEMQTVALISALLFGFSVTLWIEFDLELFDDDKAVFQASAYLFSISAICTIISSALSTVLAIAVVISLRRLMFKFGKESGSQSLDAFKRGTHTVRSWVRYFIYLSYGGFFVSIAIYSGVKLEAAQNFEAAPIYVIIWILLAVGVSIIVFVFYRIKREYSEALKIKSKSSD